MIQASQVSHRIDAYTSDMRFTGFISFMAHRRLSDVLNDSTAAFVELNHVIPAIWGTSSLTPLPEVDSMVLFKENIVAVVPAADSPAPPAAHPFDRIAKVPYRTIIYAPPLVLQGNLHFPSAVQTLMALNTLRTDFIPVTNVNIWHLRSRAGLESYLKLVLVNRRAINGLEPRGEPVAGPTEDKSAQKPADKQADKQKM